MDYLLDNAIIIYLFLIAPFYRSIKLLQLELIIARPVLFFPTSSCSLVFGDSDNM